MKINLLLFVFLLSSICAIGQPSIQWQKTIGGTSQDFASLQPTSDGGYILGGRSQSNNGDIEINYGNEDAIVIKIDDAGVIAWQKSFGGSGHDTTGAVIQTLDGGYIFTGSTGSSDGDLLGIHSNVNGLDYWIVKLSATGEIEWQNCYGGFGYDLGGSIIQLADESYLVSGGSDSTNGDVTGNHGLRDAWIIKLNNAGVIQWQKSIGGSGYDYLSSMQQTTDGGFALCGSTNSSDGDVTGNQGDEDFWIVKLDAAGAIEWQKCYGGTFFDVANSILQTSDNGYILCGYNSSNPDDTWNILYDAWVVKVDSLGTIEWQSILGGSGYDSLSGIYQTTAGDYILSGSTDSTEGDVVGNHGGYDGWIVKLNNWGVFQWQKTVGGSGFDFAGRFWPASDSTYIFGGYTSSNDGDVSGNHGDFDCWVVKLDANLVTNSYVSESQFILYPNPATDYINLQMVENTSGSKYSIYDLSGKLVKSAIINNEEIIKVDDLATGVYNLRVDNLTIKFVKE